MKTAGLAMGAACAVVLFGVPCPAHDLQTRVSQSAGVVTVEASYEGREEASFLAVTVKGPPPGGAAPDAFQTGRTDVHGRFLFQPDRAGEWAVTLDDELGHRVTSKLVVSAVSLSGGGSRADSAEAAIPRSAMERLLMGLSLILGLSGFLYGWLARRQKHSAA